MKLTLNQINTLLPLFQNEKYAGWKGIANNLLINGKCIVAGTDCIWKGGVGNFIKTSPAINAVNCTEYVLDVENFVNSAWVQEYLEHKINDVDKELQEMEKNLIDKRYYFAEIKKLNIENNKK